MVGIPSPTESTPSTKSVGVHAVAAWATTQQLTPGQAVAAWAQAQAQHLGVSLDGFGLRLVEDHGPALGAEPCPFVTGAPSDLGHLYETLLSGEVRKRRGVHLTPADIAARLVGLLGVDWIEPGARVLDPAVGGGAFLLAAADALVAAGVAPAEAVVGLSGCDHDAVAVAVAETALSLWRIDHGLEPAPASSLRVGDGLLDELPQCDVAVGNPPFLSQLRTRSANAGERRDALRARWGDLVTAYTDEAWLFLTAALDAVAPGGQLVMVQPVSVLAARHGEAVRGRIGEDARLDGLWVSAGRVFDASVEVCAPLLRRTDGEGAGAPTPKIRRWRGRDFDELNAGPPAPPAEDWGRLGAGITGIPDVRLGRSATSSATVGDLATVTAGFRDQFYGLAPYVHEAGVQKAGERDRSSVRPLATVGMLDPFQFRWGSAEFRFAGERYTAPALDADALERNDPELGRWVEARHRPKVLIATQTKVLEAWADQSGSVVPATPTISLEPHDVDNEGQLWRMLALVMTPAVSADVAAACFGTALSIRALKVSARDLALMPVPADRAAWDEGANLARSMQATAEELGQIDASTLQAFAEVMHRSFGLTPTDAADRVYGGAGQVTGWWTSGWPQRDTPTQTGAE